MDPNLNANWTFPSIDDYKSNVEFNHNYTTLYKTEKFVIGETRPTFTAIGLTLTKNINKNADNGIHILGLPITFVDYNMTEIFFLQAVKGIQFGNLKLDTLDKPLNLSNDYYFNSKIEIDFK